jgi:hypothetical protein
MNTRSPRRLRDKQHHASDAVAVEPVECGTKALQDRIGSGGGEHSVTIKYFPLTIEPQPF